MKHECTIAGKKIDLEWTQETAKRFAYRMGEVGGEPTGKALTNPKTVTTALFKVLWGLLPANVFALYPDPESLFVAVDHDEEAQAIFAAINGVYLDRYPSEEKKSTSMKSPSLESNSE
jgi:hypothetical protein